MKKIIGLLVLIIIIASGYIGYKTFFTSDNLDANGLVTIANEKHLLEFSDRYNENIRKKEVYKIKTTEVKGEKVLIINKTTAKALFKKGLLQQKDGNWEFGKPLKELPNIPKDEAILFSFDINNKDIKEVEISKEKLKVRYDSCTWIGRYPSKYDQFILLVEDEKYNAIPAKETSLAILNFKRAFGTIGFISAKAARKSERIKEEKEIDKIYPDLIGFEFVHLK